MDLPEACTLLPIHILKARTSVVNGFITKGWLSPLSLNAEKIVLNIVLNKTVLNIVGKKVKVSLRLFDIFQKNRVFIFSCESWASPLTDCTLRQNWLSKFDNSLSFGAKQNALRHISFVLWFFKDLFMKNSNWFFFFFLWFYVGSRKECVYVCLSMQIQGNLFMSIAAHLWGCYWAF